MAAGAVSLRKSHDIVISSFCNIVKGQANYYDIQVRYRTKNLICLLDYDEAAQNLILVRIGNNVVTQNVRLFQPIIP